MGIATYRIQPVCVQDLLGVGTLWDEHGPLAAVLTRGVFPLRLNALLEEMEVCAHCQPAGWLDVVVQAAQTQKKLFHMTRKSLSPY